METAAVDKTIDCKGLSCPMPIVKTKKAMEEIREGQVLEVEATDPGSVADIKSWAARTGHQHIGTIENSGVYKHYIRKGNPGEEITEKKHPNVISTEELQSKLHDKPLILDVREPMEYAFGHIPGAKLVPFGKLEETIEELKPYSNQEVHVVCRTGIRSDAACQILTEKGFSNVKNVMPGMSGWTGPIEKTTT